VSFLASIEAGGVSQPLGVGVSMTDHSDYFKVLLSLVMEVWGELIGSTPERPLLIVSDEDKAFLKACRETLRDYVAMVCVWHKLKSARKPRKSAVAEEFETAATDESEDEFQAE
jgi:hypothetical protein